MNSTNIIICAKFLIPGFSYSDTSIDSVVVMGNNSKGLKKKSKNISKSGYFEIRLT